TVFRSIAIERLLRLHDRNDADMPFRPNAKRRIRSPAGDSTLITSALWSARIIAATGPATIVVRSRTRTAARGPDIVLLHKIVNLGSENSFSALLDRPGAATPFAGNQPLLAEEGCRWQTPSRGSSPAEYRLC